ncbi:MAG: 7TM diverse intracellular signaling domain-containing protein, partial [Spirochaetota bacterium]
MNTDKFRALMEPGLYGNLFGKKIPLYSLFLIIPLFTLLFVLYILLVPIFHTNSLSREAIHGILDLSDLDETQMTKVALRGEWEFYWKQFLVRLPKNGKVNYIKLPSAWNSSMPEQTEFSLGQGYATFALKVKLPSQARDYSIKLRPISSAYKLYINGKKVGENGVLGKTLVGEKPGLHNKIYHLGKQANQIDLVLQVSNFQLNYGGLRRQILLGTTEEIVSVQINSNNQKLFFAGAFYLIGIYHLGLHFIRRAKDTFYFGIFCFIGSLYMFVDNELLLYHYFPQVPWLLTIRLQYIMLYFSTITAVLYVYYLYPRDFPLRQIRAIIAVTIVFFILTLFFSAR